VIYCPAISHRTLETSLTALRWYIVQLYHTEH
jgi:hypothetical protein